MSSLLLWSCKAPGGCTIGTVVNDEQGKAEHQAAAGHAPVLGKPMAWVFDRDAGT
jgi:hypothetical protein